MTQADSLIERLEKLKMRIAEQELTSHLHAKANFNAGVDAALAILRQHLADQAALPQPVEVSEEALVAVLVKHFMSEILRSFPNATTVPSYWHHEEKVRPILAALRAAGFKIMEAA